MYYYYRVHRKYRFDLHCFIGIRNPDWNLWWSLTDFKYKHLVWFSAVIREMQTPMHSYRSTKVQELLATSILERWKLFGNARMSFHQCKTSASTTFRINCWKSTIWISISDNMYVILRLDYCGKWKVLRQWVSYGITHNTECHGVSICH